MLKIIRLSLFVAAMMAALPLEAGLAQAGKPTGIWSMGKVTVKVRDCGGGLCGAIVGLKEPISKIDGKPKADCKNPDYSKRMRPLIGLAVLIGMNPVSTGEWQGAIYNPNDGNTYSASITVVGDTLKVEGCGGGILCKTTNFARIN